jgi:hypothetical protein
MRANFGALLQNNNAALGVELLEPDRSGEAGRPGTDDNYFIFHRFAFNLGHHSCSISVKIGLK